MNRLTIFSIVTLSSLFMAVYGYGGKMMMGGYMPYYGGGMSYGYGGGMGLGGGGGAYGGVWSFLVFIIILIIIASIFDFNGGGSFGKGGKGGGYSYGGGYSGRYSKKGGYSGDYSHSYSHDCHDGKLNCW